VIDNGPGVSDEEFTGLTANKRFRGDEASTRRPGGRGLGLARLALRSDPGEQLAALAQYRLQRPDGNLAGAHFFSFGGAVKTAQWMSAASAPDRARRLDA